MRSREEFSVALRAAQDMEGVIEAERTVATAALDTLRGEIHALLDTARSRGPADLRELDQMREGLQDAQSLSAAFRMQMDHDRQAFEEEIAQLQAENTELRGLAEKAMVEQARIAASTEGQRTRGRALEFELEKERKQNAFLTAEMDALRNEAASQVAQANVLAGEMEGRMARLREALDLVLQRGKSAALHADALSAAFTQASAALLAAREDLAALEVPGDALDTDATPNGIAQPSLFDTSPFMRELAALPGSFESATGIFDAPPSNAPRPLLDLVEEALSGEGPAQP